MLRSHGGLFDSRCNRFAPTCAVAMLQAPARTPYLVTTAPGATLLAISEFKGSAGDDAGSHIDHADVAPRAVLTKADTSTLGS